MKIGFNKISEIIASSFYPHESKNLLSSNAKRQPLMIMRTVSIELAQICMAFFDMVLEMNNFPPYEVWSIGHMCGAKCLYHG
jgi:hypothetical protein